MFGRLVFFALASYLILLSNNGLFPVVKAESDMEQSPQTTPTPPPPDATTTPTATITTTAAPSGRGCRLPKLNPFDASILAISRTPVPGSKCLEKYDLIFNVETHSNGSSFLILIKHPEESGWKECCYNLVLRKYSNSDNEQVFSEECYPIPGNASGSSQEIPRDHEFLAIFCNSTKNASLTHIMLDGFPLTPLKPQVEDRISKYYKESKEEEVAKVNLLVFGLDAVSHLNFQRIMPKVHQYLVHNLSAFGFNGYTKMGENTHPNVLAMLGNQTLNESEESCAKTRYFDSCPLIFKYFASHGYRTSFGEDSPWMGAFNFNLKGFMTQPTDYYLRPMAQVLEERIKSDHHGNSDICYGPRLTIQFLLDYMKTMATGMGDRKRYFQFVWTTAITHDYLNLGHMGEPHLMEFVLWMEAKGHLNHTVLVLNSDHGVRWGPISDTRQGKIEYKMPLLYFVFPIWFRLKYPEAVKNMAKNVDRLTSPWDTYATFLDLSELGRIEGKEIQKRTKELENDILENRVVRGISLFLPIPIQRNCQTAGIGDYFCACHPTQGLPPSDPEVVEAANFAVFVLNSKISRNYSQCANLSLGSVGSALQVNDREDGGKVKGVKMMDLAFSTLPGNWSFDATLIKDDKVKEWQVSGEIIRTNFNGNQSYCVINSDIKNYCYCLPSG